jgi:UDP-glucose 4-epimerase
VIAVSNILITGHMGLIGAPLTQRLVDEGHTIVKGIDLRAGEDILDINKMHFDQSIDTVVHCAAACKINRTIENPDWSHINNTEGTYQVFEFCRLNNVKKIVNFSSSRVLSPEKNPYTTDKLFGEELCKAYKNCFDLDYIIIRPSTVYGPCWDKTKRLVHLYITNALRNQDLVIFGDPKTKTLDFTYVDDFVDGVLLAMNHHTWNKAYDISGGEEFKVYDLAAHIIKTTGSRSNITFHHPEIAQPQSIKLDLVEINKLGYSPTVPLLEGIQRCIDWYSKYMKENKLL